MIAHDCGPKPIARNKMVSIRAYAWLVWGCTKEGISVFPTLCIKIYNEELEKLIHSDRNQEVRYFYFLGDWDIRELSGIKKMFL